MKMDALREAAAAHGLFVMGSLDPEDAPGTVVLLGAGPECWPAFTASEEFHDGLLDPLDRWSKRVIGAIADSMEASAVYPSDGPPYLPFIRWARESGRFFQSPTGMLVHDIAGLMISIRGAIVWPQPVPRDIVLQVSPCEECAAPCTSACPVGALSVSAPYDVPACKAWLDTDPEQDCMGHGCAVRRACPISQSFGRTSAQSAFHMAAFKG